MNRNIFPALTVILGIILIVLGIHRDETASTSKKLADVLQYIGPVSEDSAGRFIADRSTETDTCIITVPGLPDYKCTPGAVDPNVTQANIRQTICVLGYTKTVRPPVSYTNKIKKQQMAAYGLVGKMGDYEEDHQIPLELGGSPADPANLWPESYQPFPGAKDKDHVENYLHKQVCNGSLSLAEAQQAIAKDWLKVYRAVPDILNY